MVTLLIFIFLEPLVQLSAKIMSIKERCHTFFIHMKRKLNPLHSLDVIVLTRIHTYHCKNSISLKQGDYGSAVALGEFFFDKYGFF